MQDESTPQSPEAEPGDAPPEGSQAAAEAAAGEAPAELQQLRDKLAESEAKAVENWERYLRATAEQDNIRKRSEREVDAARRFALEKFAQDLLAVWDSLELGLKAAQDAGAETAQVEGIELTLRMLGEAMGRHGVKAIDPKGEAFNPEKHEAMSAVPTDEAPPNTVIDVMQKGYSLNDRVLRPAMVVVARAKDPDAA